MIKCVIELAQVVTQYTNFVQHGLKVTVTDFLTER